MDFKGEIKLTKDEYAGFYSSGLTMLGSSTMRRFAEDNSDKNKTLYKSADGMELEVRYKKDDISDSTEILTSFTNNSNETVTLELLTSFLIPGIKTDKIHRILSFWSAEGRVKTDTINSLNMEMSWNKMAFRVEKFGNVGSMPVRKYFPFIALEDSENGIFTAIMLYSPASWQIEVICRQDESLTVAGGIADRDFGHWTKQMKPGEKIVAPKAVVAVGKTLEEACDKLVKSQKPDISPVDNEMGITFNEYCATWGNPNKDTIKQVCDKVAGKGIQYLVMDSGWYGNDDGYWWDYLGNWNINKNRFPEGLKPAADYIRSKGMIPGIWFEFESVAHGCELYNQPEHLVRRDGMPLTIGGRRFLDMEDPFVQDFLQKNVIDLLKNAGYGYIKVDYNDTMGIGCDGEDGFGENLRRKVLATQDFFRKMREEIPDLVIENCSSGGHRLEPSMMELSSMASFSDAHEINSIPIIAANLHRVIRPEQNQIWAVMRKDDSDERIYYSLCATMLGRMGLSGDIYDLSEHQWKLIDEGMKFYKLVADVIKNGTTINIINDADSYNKPKGGQLVVRKYGKKVLIIYHRFEGSKSLEEFCKDKNLITIKFYEKVAQYGYSTGDFSACAILFKEK